MKPVCLTKTAWRSTLAALGLAGALAMLLPVATGSVRHANAATCAAGDVALKAGNAFVQAASNRSPTQFSSALRSYTDMRGIALFALGKHRSKLSKNQERTYVNLTSEYIARTLADFSRKFRASSVEVVRCSGRTVESRLMQLGGRPPQKVLWKISGSQVQDVNVQNVWLAQLLRSNFSTVLSKGGGDIDVLMAHLGGNPGTRNKVDQK